MTSDTRQEQLKRRRPLHLLGMAAVALWVSHTHALSNPKPKTATKNLEFAPVKPLKTTQQRTTSSLEDAVSCDNEMDFDLRVGKALDTLRKDYPDILTEQPDFSIYDRNIEVVDPSGVTVHGLKTYKNSFRLLHALVKFIYCPENSSLTFRMCYDKARHNIRIHWNAEVVPRQIFGGSRTTLYVDGISVYEMDRSTGNITQHRFEQLIMNNNPVRPKEGVIERLRQEHGVTVPSYIRGDNLVVKFQTMNPLSTLLNGSPSSLFAMEASSSDSYSQNDEFPDLDWEALERKNKSRKKFGLKPLTPEEFVELQTQVSELEQRQRAAAASSAAEMSSKQQEAKPNFFDKMFGNVLKDTCETNFDCERPEICCDFGFKKMCCSSGSMVGLPDELKQAVVPVPVDIGYPEGQGPGTEPRTF